MKKRIVLLALIAAITVSMPIHAFAVTPQYKPVSKQSWYKNFQTALDNAYKAGEEAGKEAVKDIEFKFDFSKIVLK